jgi:adenylate cyclase
MSNKGLNRKLAAILSADVKGYSRLMGEDEDFTVSTLTAYRKIMTALIDQHRGRVVDSPGDNLLAEFASAVNAVRCAVEIQTELEAKNAELPENRKMEFRIGINLGDLIEEGERIYGDGVNIAARLESLAEAGGICISRTVFEHIENKLTLGYEYLGEQAVKNIQKPVRVYRILTESKAAGKVIGKKRIRSKPLQWAVVATGVVIVGFAALAIWNFYFRSTPPREKVSTISKPVIPLAERASIAVLPFKNLSGDPEQEYFSDGITNDIITDLSKFRQLLVIASNTVFTYKDKSVKVKEVGRELGVRYVLEGSVQKLSQKIRINAQLIDAATESSLGRAL